MSVSLLGSRSTRLFILLTAFFVGNAVVADRPFTNPRSVFDTFVQAWRRDGSTAITSADLRTAGPLFRYWGNTVTLAAGGEEESETWIEAGETLALLDGRSDDLLGHGKVGASWCWRTWVGGLGLGGRLGGRRRPIAESPGMSQRVSSSRRNHAPDIQPC